MYYYDQAADVRYFSSSINDIKMKRFHGLWQRESVLILVALLIVKECPISLLVQFLCNDENRDAATNNQSSRAANGRAEVVR